MSQHTLQTSDTPQQSTAGVALAPADVDFFPPIVHSFVTLFRLLGKTISPNHIMATLGNNPASPKNCQRAVQSLGLQARLIHKEKLSDISPLLLPCMLILHSQRSCVLNAMDESTASVTFPEHGQQVSSVSLEALGKEYSGYAFFASLAPQADSRVNPIVRVATQHWFWDSVFHYAPLYRQIILASIAINTLAIIGPLFFMNVYDRVVPNSALETLWVLAVGVITGYLFEYVLRLLRNYFSDSASKNIDTVLATRIMQKILGMRLADRPSSSGALMNNLRDFEGVREFFSSATLLTLIDFPFLLLFLFIVYLIGGILVVVPLMALAVLLCVIFFMQFSIRRTAMIEHQGSIEKNAHLVEMVSGLEAIKMAVAENNMLQTWEKIVGFCAKSTLTAKKFNSFATNSAIFISQLVSVAVIAVGVYLIKDGLLTMGGLIACNILVGRSMSFVMQLAALSTRYQQTRIGLSMLNHFMALPSERRDEASTVDFASLPHSLECVHVDFSYKNAHLPIISDLNLIIKPGEKIGVIGNMGSGKSTLSRLLAGLYEPDKGSIKFGGVDLRQLDMTELRTRIGYLAQEPVLFHGSVRDNIALGSRHIHEQLIARAAWIAGVTDFVRQHPAGFGMPVGERGQNLSGGQRQSIALARALLYDPDILILDEPTSNIDGMTEMRIKQRLLKVIARKTLIINMHRMSLLSLTTRVLVLENGKITMDGPTKDVIARLQNPQNPTPKGDVSASS